MMRRQPARTSTPPRRSWSAVATARGPGRLRHQPGTATSRPPRTRTPASYTAVQKRRPRSSAAPATSPSSSTATRAPTSPGRTACRASCIDFLNDPNQDLDAFLKRDPGLLGHPAAAVTWPLNPDPTVTAQGASSLPPPRRPPAGGAAASRRAAGSGASACSRGVDTDHARPDGWDPDAPRRRLLHPAATIALGRPLVHELEWHRRARQDQVHRAQELRGPVQHLPALLAGGQPQHHLAGLVPVHRDAARHAARGAAGQEHPRHAHLPERAVHAGRAVAGDRRLHLEAHLRPGAGVPQQHPRAATAQGNQITGWATRASTCGRSWSPRAGARWAT